MYYASFGDIVFKVYSYLEHKETNEYAVAKHETIFAPSSLQFLGTELREIQIKIGFHRDFCDPMNEYEKLVFIADEGLPHKLIVAEQVLGDFVIKSIESEVKQIDMWGKPIAIYCDVKFIEYIEKELQTRAIKTRKRKRKRKGKAKQKPPAIDVPKGEIRRERK